MTAWQKYVGPEFPTFNKKDSYLYKKMVSFSTADLLSNNILLKNVKAQIARAEKITVETYLERHKDIAKEVSYAAIYIMEDSTYDGPSYYDFCIVRAETEKERQRRKTKNEKLRKIKRQQLTTAKQARKEQYLKLKAEFEPEEKT